MSTAVWLIQEVIRTERMVKDQFMDDYKIIVHITEETRRKFDVINPALIDNNGCNKLRGHDVVIDTKNLIEIVKEL